MFTCTSKQADAEALENLAKISPTRINLVYSFYLCKTNSNKFVSVMSVFFAVEYRQGYQGKFLQEENANLLVLLPT